MNPNDDEKVTGAESGLGHDPLEWLDDNEDVMEITVEANESAPQTKVAEASEGAEPETPEHLPTEAAPDGAAEISSFTFENQKAVLKLPEKLVVQIIEPLHSEWRTLLYDAPQSLDVDASEVKYIDAAGLQLVYVLFKQMSAKGIDVAILNVNDELKRHFSLFGLEDFFAPRIHAA